MSTPYGRMPIPDWDVPGKPLRWAVINVKHQEVLSANHKNIGEAFNSMDEDYLPATGMVVVCHRGDKILGEVRRNGALKKDSIAKLPETIWGGAKHPFYEPGVAERNNL